MIQSSPIHHLNRVSSLVLIFPYGPQVVDIEASVILPSSISFLISLLTVTLLLLWPSLIVLALIVKQEPCQYVPGETAIEELQNMLIREDVILNLGTREIPFPSPPHAFDKSAWRSKQRKIFIKKRVETFRLLDPSRLCYRCFEMRPYRT